MLGRFVDAFDFIPIIDGACEEIVLLSLRLSYKLPSRTISYMACTCTSKVFPNENCTARNHAGTSTFLFVCISLMPDRPQCFIFIFDRILT